MLRQAVFVRCCAERIYAEGEYLTIWRIILGINRKILYAMERGPTADAGSIPTSHRLRRSIVGRLSLFRHHYLRRRGDHESHAGDVNRQMRDEEDLSLSRAG